MKKHFNMNDRSLIVLSQELPKARAKILFEEFRYAWDKTSSSEKKEWAKEKALISK